MVLNKESEIIGYFFTKSINVTNSAKNVMDKRLVKKLTQNFLRCCM